MPDRIGPYQVSHELGRGGMGVVYLARDTRLDRDVAIKALPVELASDPARLKRFEREARTLAQLNHPNLAGIHGVEEQDGAKYLVLEYVEGESLAEMLDRGPLPVDEAIELAVQIAAGLEAAHEAGVIHRDLKPGNVIVTPDGRAKVLDFGLARVDEGGQSSSGGLDSPTMTTPLPQHSPTIAGAILGTAAYMSPEQARGRRVDKRTDIWSFGVVLYEMLTEASPFRGETVSDSIGAVLHKEVDLDCLPAQTPSSIVRLIERCLRRDPKRRLQSIGDARIELEEEWSESGIATDQRGGGRGWLVASWATSAVLLAGIAIVLAMRPATNSRGSASDGGAIERSELVLGPEGHINWFGTNDTWGKIGYSQLIAMSRDGRVIVFTVQDSESTSLFMKRAEDFGAREIGGSAGGRGAFLSPNGEWVGFLAENDLFKVRLPGGARSPICEINSSAFGATWLDDDSIVFSSDTGLWRVPSTGGSPERLTSIDTEAGVRGHLNPHAIPGAELILFTVATDTGLHAAVLSLEDSHWQIIKRNTAHARSVDGRFLVFARGGELYASPYDPRAPFAVGSESSILHRVHRSPGQGGSVVHAFATSDDGDLAYAPESPPPEPDSLVWVDQEGREEEIVRGDGFWLHQRLSPDGERILLNRSTSDGMLDLWIYEIEQDLFNRLTHLGNAYDAEWSPDGRRTGFAAMSNAGRAIFLLPSDFSTDQADRIIDASDARPHFTQWAGDDSTLLFFDRSSRGGLWSSSPDEGTLAEISNTSLGESWANISPDGALIAFVGWTGAQRDVYVQAYPELGRRIRVSRDGGGEPLWGNDSRTLFFREDGKIYKSTIETSPQLTVASLEALPFEDIYDAAASGHQHYDLSVDGERFLMVKHGKRSYPTTLRIVRRWPAMLDLDTSNE